MVKDECDILIVGGGLTGGMLLLALSMQGYRVLLVESQPLSIRTQPDFDARSLALSRASLSILKMLKLWPQVQENATPIEHIHISEQGQFGHAWLHQTKQPLGYVVEMQHLNQALHQLLSSHQIMAPAEVLAFDCSSNSINIRTSEGEKLICAKLVIAADGANSLMRRFCHISAEIKDYGQHAIVANLGLNRPHQQTAYERFTKSGPLAVLPMTNARAALVWSVSPHDAKYWSEVSEQHFLHQLQHVLGYRLGRLNHVGQRHIFPIQQVYMPQCVVNSVVFIGNAAHTLHPVAGQGFNLGLRDVAMLAQCIKQYGLGETMLGIYQQKRYDDQRSIRYFTDQLVELFRHSSFGMGMLRGCGLLAFDQLPLAKTLLMRYAEGYGGKILPDWVCGISV